MKYLFIDGSHSITYAQVGKGETFQTKSFDTKRCLAGKISSICDEMLQLANISKNDLDIFAVGTGPGSLTGIRVACSFFRTCSLLTKKPLLDISLFEWAFETLKEQGEANEARIIIPTLIDKAFALDLNLDLNIDFSEVKPTLVNLKGIDSSKKNFGVGYQAENITQISLSDKAINKIIRSKNLNSNFDMENLLKVLPMYIIPSQAERKLLEK